MLQLIIFSLHWLAVIVFIVFFLDEPGNYIDLVLENEKLFSPPADVVHLSTIPIIKWHVW